MAIIEDLAAAETIHCSVRGRITRCGESASSLRVICVHHQQIGFPDENERCRGGLPMFRTVGDVHTDSHGDFAFAFDALARPFGACSFLSRARVDVYDGATRIWASGYRAVAPLMRFDRELLPNCRAGSTVVRVIDDAGNIVAGAEVFANGTLRGTTDATGHVFVDPPLEAGDELVARRLIRENGSPKDGHDVDSDRNWNYRVWITSLGVRHDSDGDDVTLPQYTISNPDEVQQLRVRARNAIIGLNLRASIEWDASSTEFDRIHDRLCDLSELLYNATEGQFFVAELALSDDGHSWDDADVRIYANMNYASNASRGGIFEDDGRLRMNPNDAYFAGFYLHELGHYAFGLGDEYPDNGTVVCTPKSKDPEGPYANGNEKDACLMRGSQYEDQKKFCSAHPLNPHVLGTDQGRQDCWTDILELYSDPDRRWRVLTPVNRGAIVGRLPDSGVPLKGSSQPSGVARPPSFIPLAGWKPRDHNLRVQHLGLCEGLIVRVTRGGTPVVGALVMLHTSQGRSIYQGKTKTEYNLAYGVRTGVGAHGARLPRRPATGRPAAERARGARGRPPRSGRSWSGARRRRADGVGAVRADGSAETPPEGAGEPSLPAPVGRGGNVRRVSRRPPRRRRISARARVQRHRRSVRGDGRNRRIRDVRTGRAPQRLRELVSRLQRGEETLGHLHRFRPWGTQTRSRTESGRFAGRSNKVHTTPTSGGRTMPRRGGGGR